MKTSLGLLICLMVSCGVDFAKKDTHKSKEKNTQEEQVGFGLGATTIYATCLVRANSSVPPLKVTTTYSRANYGLPVNADINGICLKVCQLSIEFPVASKCSQS